MHRLAWKLVLPFTVIAQTKKDHRFTIGTCYIPHPAKRFRGGEDAHLATEKVMAICDGVSAWYKEDAIDAGNYALQFIQFLSKTKEDDPMAMVQSAHKTAVSQQIEGSATLCVARLAENLKVCNLGDAGIKVYRNVGPSSWAFFNKIVPHDFKVIAASTPMRHIPNRPFQLGSHDNADDPQMAQQYEFTVQCGDVVIMGSDGLWDTDVDIEYILNTTNLTEPTKIAWQIGTLAAQSAERLGELDDITVMVAKIEELTS